MVGSRNRRWLLCLVIGLVPLIGSVLHASAEKPVEPFILNDPTGKPVRLDHYLGQVVMVNFWATWCAPCVEELPTLQALKHTFSGQPFEILAINSGEDRERIHAFLAALPTPVNFPVLLDPAMAVASAWNLLGLPTTVLIDKQGQQAARYTGSRDWDDASSRQLVARLINE